MPKPTNSVLIALRVLEQVSVEQPVGVSDLARSLSLPKSTVHRMLQTLEAAGWAWPGPSGWSLAVRAAAVGSRVPMTGALVSVARPVMRDLAAATQESVRLWLVDDRTFLLLAEVDGPQAVRPVVPEVSVALHTTALGKAVLAGWPPGQLDRFLETPLTAVTSETITTPDDLRRELDRVRLLGYASAWNEAHRDVGGVATTFALPGGGQAALAVTFPVHRVTSDLVAEFGELITVATKDLVQRVEA